jgi:hypothetical protein
MILSVTPSPANQPLYALLTGAEPASIADVIARMEAIDGLLGDDDGLKWFNRLYLMVTQQVDLNPPGGAWKSPVWLTKLDIVFAGLYFSALANSLVGMPIPAAWTALFEVRYKQGIDRIQFAMAGMNAHINHDLPLALDATNAALGVNPGPAGLEFADYQSVNTLLNATTPTALTMLAADTFGVFAQDTGKVGRLLAYWNIIKARTLAWDVSLTLPKLVGPARDAMLDAQDGLTGLAGRLLLRIDDPTNTA